MQQQHLQGPWPWDLPAAGEASLSTAEGAGQLLPAGGKRDWVEKVQMDLGLPHCLSAAPWFLICSRVFQTWGSNPRELYPWQGMEVGWGTVNSVWLSVFFRMLTDLPSPGKTQWMTIKKIRSKKLYDTKVLPLSLWCDCYLDMLVARSWVWVSF